MSSEHLHLQHPQETHTLVFSAILVTDQLVSVYVLRTNWGPTDRVLFMQILLVRTLLLWKNGS